MKKKMKIELLKEFPDNEDLINLKLSKLKCDDIFEKEQIISSTCNARVWNNHRGTKCTNLKCVGNYCKVHDKMIKKHGKLLFGDYFEERPLYKDGIKLQWFDMSEKEELNILLKYQNMKLLDIISKSEKISKSVLYFKYRQIIRND